MKTPYESIRLAYSPFLVTESMQTLSSAFYEQASESDTFVFVISLLASKEKKKCVNMLPPPRLNLNSNNCRMQKMLVHHFMVNRVVIEGCGF